MNRFPFSTLLPSNQRSLPFLLLKSYSLAAPSLGHYPPGNYNTCHTSHHNSSKKLVCTFFYESFMYDHIYTTRCIFSTGVSHSRTRAEEEEESKWKKRCLYCIDLFCWWDCCWPWVKFAKAIEWFIMDAFIDLFITLCIVVNTMFMALDHNSMSLEFERTLKTGNYVSFIM